MLRNIGDEALGEAATFKKKKDRVGKAHIFYIEPRVRWKPTQLADA